MDWVYYLVLIAVQLCGLGLALFQMPGLWLMLGGTAIYAWVTASRGYVPMWGLIALLILAAVSEVLELAAGGAGAKRAGASRLAIMAAMVGGVVGAIVGSFVIPIPIAGTIIGACAGSFLAALTVELWRFGDVGRSLRVGYGAAKGRFLGIVAKLTVGVVMLIATLLFALPIHAKYAPTPPGSTTSLLKPILTPSTTPAALPATMPTFPFPPVSIPTTLPTQRPLSTTLPA